jgi:hypothetical protein
MVAMSMAVLVINCAAVVDAAATITSLVGGPAQKMIFFQIVPKSFLSVLIPSTRCKYNSIFFFEKKMTGTCPLGGSNVK